MGRHNVRQREEANQKRKTVNPFMRGIGCLFMVIVPIFSYAVGDNFAKQYFGLGVLPQSWYGPMTISSKLTQLTGFRSLATWLTNNPIWPATLAIAVVATIVIGGIITIIYGYMYSLMAPSKRGPMDIPPPRVKTKKYKR